MSLNKGIEGTLKDVFGDEFKVNLYGDACYIEFFHAENPASIAVGLITYPSSIKVRETCTVFKRFDEVESILQPILDKYKINLGFWKSTIFKDFKVDQYEFDKEDFTAIKGVFENIKSIGLSQRVEFLDLYKELNQVYEASEKMEVKEMVGFISQPLALRRMVIKKLCNDRGFEDFCSQYIESAQKKAKAKPSQFKGYDKASEELYSILKSIHLV